VAHWNTIEQGAQNHFIFLHSRTRRSGIKLGAAVHLWVDGTAEAAREVWDAWGQPTCVVRCRLDAGQSLSAIKCVAVYTSREVSDPVPRALATLAKTKGDFASLLQTSDSAWNKYWATANVIIVGDEQAQQAVRYNLFQLLIAAPQQDDDVSIAAKTLSGFGYGLTPLCASRAEPRLGQKQFPVHQRPQTEAGVGVGQAGVHPTQVDFAQAGDRFGWPPSGHAPIYRFELWMERHPGMFTLNPDGHR
jgi:hypothetical protein